MARNVCKTCCAAHQLRLKRKNDVGADADGVACVEQASKASAGAAAAMAAFRRGAHRTTTANEASQMPSHSSWWSSPTSGAICSSLIHYYHLIDKDALGSLTALWVAQLPQRFNHHQAVCAGIFLTSLRDLGDFNSTTTIQFKCPQSSHNSRWNGKWIFFTAEC